MSFRGNINGQLRGFYYASSGDDNFNGQTVEVPKLTIQAAINAATSLSPVPSGSNVALVTASQGGSFTESITMGNFVQFKGEDTTLTSSGAAATVTLATGLRFQLVNASNSGAGNTFNLAGLSDIGLFCGCCSVSTGVGVAISGTVSDVFVDINDLDVTGVSGTGIQVTSTNTIPIDINVDTCQLEANNARFMVYNAALTTSECVVRISSVDTSAAITGTTAFLVQNGVLEVEVSGHIEAATAITVQSGATLRINCAHINGTITVESGGLLQIMAIAVTGAITINSGGTMEADIINHSGTVTNNGTLTGQIDDTFYGAKVFNDSFSVTGQLNVVSGDPDTSSVLRNESTGTNGGVTNKFVGDRDPNGNVTGAGGDEYYRDSAGTSATYESKEVTTGTEWFKRSAFPIDIIEINTAAEFEALATAGVITLTKDMTIVMNVTVTTSARFVLSSFALTITGPNRTINVGLIYAGTGDFVSGDGMVRFVNNINITSSSTGTLFNIAPVTVFSSVLMDDATLNGWDDLGSVTNGFFVCRSSSFNDCVTGFAVADIFIIQLFSVLANSPAMTGPFLSVSTNNPDSFMIVDTVFMTLSATGSIFDVSSRIPDTSRVTVTGADILVGAGLFKPKSGADATINSVADSALSNGTITAMADSGPGTGSTTISCTTTYFEGESVTISGTTSYNGEFRIFNVVASTSFDIFVTFVADDATGTVVTDRIAITLATSHGIVALDDLKIISTNFYNGFVTALNFPSTDVMIVNGDFVSTNTGAIERNLSLDQTDRRIGALSNPNTVDSSSIACGHVNNNSTANGAIVNNTFTDMVFGTVGSALLASSTMERWRLIDELDATFEYIGREPFDGFITFDFTVTSSGGTVEFRFKWQKDTGSGFVDLADNVESLVSVASDAQSVTKTFPLSANKGDLIKPQITRNSGSSGITASYATIYVTG